MTKGILLKSVLVSIFGIIMIILINLPASFALEPHAQDQDVSLISRTDLTIGVSIESRYDDLDWNIAGYDDDGNFMSILSKLEFNDMDILQIGLDANLIVDHVYYRGSIYFGQINDGQATDSDFGLNTSTNETELDSKSLSKISNDNVFDLTLGMGYQLEFLNQSLRIVPLAGISHHEQDIRITEGIQVVTSPGFSALGPFSETLNSTYETQWKSGWFGMDMHYKATTSFSLSSSFEYHIADYDAKANWNLRTDYQHPVSFIHKADGRGYVAKVGINYAFALSKTSTWTVKGDDKEGSLEKDKGHKTWNIGLAYSWSKWSADIGVDYLFLANGLTAATRLNEVNWESQSLKLSLSYEF